LLRNAKYAIKKIEQKTEGGKKNGGKKATFFVVSPDGLLLIFLVFGLFLNSPWLLRNAQKRDKTVKKSK
jgi:hypothetical protein